MIRRNSRENPFNFPDRALLSKVCSLFYQDCTHREISAALGISMGMVQRYLERRKQLPFDELDQTGQVAYRLWLEQSERDLEHFMPAALDGDFDSAKAAIDAIKRRCHFLGLYLR